MVWEARPIWHSKPQASSGQASKCPSKSWAVAQEDGEEGGSCHPAPGHPPCLLLAPALPCPRLHKAPIVYCFARLTPRMQLRAWGTAWVEKLRITPEEAMELGES